MLRASLCVVASCAITAALYDSTSSGRDPDAGMSRDGV
jgi:hypothetical protein